MTSRRIKNQILLMNELGRVVTDSIARAAGFRQFGRLEKSFRFLANRNRVSIYSIYYWVRFVNDGRRAISLPQNRPPMIFFKDPADDPRISSDYPRTRATRRRLTHEEFVTARAAGQLIVTRSVDAVAPSRFIEEGIKEARQLVPEKVIELIREDVRQNIRRRRDKITISL